MLLGPTKACTEAIRCIEEHLRLLKGNVNREVLEVFETEVGVRLIGFVYGLFVSFTLRTDTYSAITQHSTETPKATNHLAEWWFPSYRRSQCLPYLRLFVEGTLLVVSGFFSWALADLRRRFLP